MRICLLFSQDCSEQLEAIKTDLSKTDKNLSSTDRNLSELSEKLEKLGGAHQQLETQVDVGAADTKESLVKVYFPTVIIERIYFIETFILSRTT